MSFLPIKKNALKYGSNNSGRDVYADIPELNNEMRLVGKYLNLAGHHVGNQDEPLWLCGDIEGHEGRDGKYYALDFARIFPPQMLPSEYVPL